MSVLAGAPSGLIRVGVVASAFKTTKLERPPSTIVPFGTPVISSTLTVMLAVGEVETAKTDTATPECADTWTSKVVTTGEGGVGGPAGGVGPGLLMPAVNDANPLVGEPGG